MSESVHIQTTQNVVIDYEPAGLGNRILAGFLDTVFKAAYVLVVIYLLVVSKGFGTNNITAVVIYVVIIFLPVILYHLLFEIFMQGQSLGKRIVKIKVVKLDGTQPSVGAYFLRWFLRIVEVDMLYGLIAIITIAASKNKQRIGDMAAGTTVIRIKPQVTLKETILHATPPKSDYKIVFQQVSSLTEKDIELMKEVLDFYKKTGNPIVLSRISSKLKEKTGIHSDLKDADFIATLMKDYNHYKFEE